MDSITKILQSIFGKVGFNSKKLKDAVWNFFCRGFQAEPEEDGTPEGSYKIGDDVVGDFDGAIDAGIGEAFDGPAIRKGIKLFMKWLRKFLFETEQSVTGPDKG